MIFGKIVFDAFQFVLHLIITYLCHNINLIIKNVKYSLGSDWVLTDNCKLLDKKINYLILASIYHFYQIRKNSNA